MERSSLNLIIYLNSITNVFGATPAYGRELLFHRHLIGLLSYFHVAKKSLPLTTNN